MDHPEPPLARRTVGALRAEHNALAAAVRDLGDDELAQTSGAESWTVAQVLSHLGSGSELLLDEVARARGTSPPPPQRVPRSVWARWDALAPSRQREEFLVREDELVALFEDLDPRELATLGIAAPGFGTLSMTAFAGLRLYEVALHSWDARVAAAPGAALDADTASVLAEHLAGDLTALVRAIGHADRLRRPVRLDLGSGYRLSIDDTASVVAGESGESTGTWHGPLEAALRLVGGRLGPLHTPAGLSTTGDTDLEELRSVFPGF